VVAALGCSDDAFHPGRAGAQLLHGRHQGPPLDVDRDAALCIRHRVRVTAGIDSRVIAAEHGWWFPEEPANVKLLTDNQPPCDPAMGTYQLRALLCPISPVESCTT
jgi:hypothetical protein